MKRKMCCFFLVLVLSATGLVYAGDSNLIGSSFDWRPQDYLGSRGISTIVFNDSEVCLELACNLKGGDGQLSKGEILLDLKYVPFLEADVPLDMRGMSIEMELQVPAGFVGSPSLPNGCQVFVKDSNYNAQYGTWVNCTNSGTVVVSLLPAVSAPFWGSTTSGFQPADVRLIGLKIAVNAGSTHQFAGTFKVRKITVTPQLPFASPPSLPAAQPLPYVTGGGTVVLNGDGFYIDGFKWFVTGGNWRLIEYRQNFGSTAWFPNGNGVSRHPGFLAAKMELFRSAGITLIRVGLLDDGCSVLDVNGNVTGYNQVFRNDVSTLLSLASQFNMKVVFVLADFMIAGKAEYLSDVWLRGRRAVIEDSTVRANFMNDFLTPFVMEFGNHEALFGFDIFNEPEWIIANSEGGGWDDVDDENKAETAVSIADFRNFVSLCLQKIRLTAPGKFTTVGISCGNRAIADGLGLDYIGAHYYPNMGDFAVNLGYVSGAAPWSLEEFEGQGNIFTYLDTVYNEGGAGALVWNLSPGIDDRAYSFAQEEAKLKDIRGFVDSTALSVPVLTLNRSSFIFGVNTAGQGTLTQYLQISNGGSGTLHWSVVANVGWLNCGPTSGSGAGTASVTVNAAGLAVGTYNGLITVNDPNAVDSPQAVSVSLNVLNAGVKRGPFGIFATPVTGTTVRSSIAVTGWALDDLEVTEVKLYREEGTSLIYIGDAVFVEGARPDIETAYPDYPLNYRAGWGYMLLTNFLPAQGNGVFRLHAVATDIEGNKTTLGTTTITCDNAHAVKPFGAIDTPVQGGTVTGNAFVNWGWVLTPQPNSISGNGINVWVDGVNLGHPVYNLYREDIHALFPGYANSSGAVGYFYLNADNLAVGLHTIQWTATDSGGNTDGIGSRYFNVYSNGATGKKTSPKISGLDALGKRFFHLSQLKDIPVRGDRGLVIIKEMGLVMLEVSKEAAICEAYMMVGPHLRPLPIGSHFDGKTGTFYWQPGPGFVGAYSFVFIGKMPDGSMFRRHAVVTIVPGGTAQAVSEMARAAR